MSSGLQASMTSNLVLVLVHSSIASKIFVQRGSALRRGIVGIVFPFGLADDIADLFPHGGLRDEVDVGVGIGLPALALHDPARLTATGIVAGARCRIAERNALAELRVFRQRASLRAAAGRAA